LIIIANFKKIILVRSILRKLAVVYCLKVPSHLKTVTVLRLGGKFT